MSSKLRNTSEPQNIIMCIVHKSALWSSKQLFFTEVLLQSFCACETPFIWGFKSSGM